MRDVRDIVDIAGVAAPPQPQPSAASARRWLGVWFRCCHVYGRMTKTLDGSMYRGRCPRCGNEVRALVGPGGTQTRFFEAS